MLKKSFPSPAQPRCTKMQLSPAAVFSFSALGGVAQSPIEMRRRGKKAKRTGSYYREAGVFSVWTAKSSFFGGICVSRSARI